MDPWLCFFQQITQGSNIHQGPIDAAGPQLLGRNLIFLFLLEFFFLVLVGDGWKGKMSWGVGCFSRWTWGKFIFRAIFLGILIVILFLFVVNERQFWVSWLFTKDASSTVLRWLVAKVSSGGVDSFIKASPGYQRVMFYIGDHFFAYVLLRHRHKTISYQ